MKNFILDPFGPFWPENFKTRFLRIYVAVALNSYEKQKISTRQFFKKLEKSHFGANLGPFGPKNPEPDFFSKTSALSLFKLDDTLTSKNQKISASGSGEKLGLDFAGSKSISIVPIYYIDLLKW